MASEWLSGRRRKVMAFVTAGAVLATPLSVAAPAFASYAGAEYHVNSCVDDGTQGFGETTLRDAVDMANTDDIRGSVIYIDATCYNNTSVDPAVDTSIYLNSPLEITVDDLTIVGNLQPDTYGVHIVRNYESDTIPADEADYVDNRIHYHQNYYSGALIDVDEGSFTLDSVWLDGSHSPQWVDGSRVSELADSGYHGRAISISNDGDGATLTINNSKISNNYLGQAPVCDAQSGVATYGFQHFDESDATGDEYDSTCQVWVDGEFGTAAGAAVYAPEVDTNVVIDNSVVSDNYATGTAGAIVADRVTIQNKSLLRLNGSGGNPDQAIVNAGGAVLGLNQVVVDDSRIEASWSDGVADVQLGRANPLGAAIAVAGQFIARNNAYIGPWQKQTDPDVTPVDNFGVDGAPVNHDSVYSGALDSVAPYDYADGLYMPMHPRTEEDGEHDEATWSDNPGEYVTPESAAADDEFTDTEIGPSSSPDNCGALNTDGHLSLNRVTVTGGRAWQGNGGAVCATSLTSVNSTFYNNGAYSNEVLGLGNGGALYIATTAVLVNNTFAENTADGEGIEFWAGDQVKAAGNIFASGSTDADIQCTIGNVGMAGSEWVFNIAVPGTITTSSSCYKADDVSPAEPFHNELMSSADLHLDSNIRFNPTSQPTSGTSRTLALLDFSGAIDKLGRDAVFTASGDQALADLVPGLDERTELRGPDQACSSAPGGQSPYAVDAGAYEHCAPGPSVETLDAYGFTAANTDVPPTVGNTIHGNVNTHGMETEEIHLLLWNTGYDSRSDAPDAMKGPSCDTTASTGNWQSADYQDWTGSSLLETNGTSNDGKVEYGSFGNTDVAHDVTGLTPFKWYYACITAKTATGWAYGVPVPFITNPDAPEINFLSDVNGAVKWVDNIDTSSALLHATVNTKGPKNKADTLRFYWTSVNPQGDCESWTAVADQDLSDAYFYSNATVVSDTTGTALDPTLSEVSGIGSWGIEARATDLSHNVQYWACAKVTTDPANSTPATAGSELTDFTGPLTFTTQDIELALALDLNLNAAFNGAKTQTSGKGLKPTQPLALVNAGEIVPTLPPSDPGYAAEVKALAHSYCEDHKTDNPPPAECSLAHLYLYSTKILLQTFVIDDQGDFGGTFTIDGCPDPGQHKLKIEGTAPDGTPVSKEIFFVLDPGCKVPEASGDPHQKVNIKINNVLFPNKSYKLLPKYKAILRAYLPLLRLTDKLTITGYTETRQPSRAAKLACIILSRNRSKAVKKYLVSIGMKPTQLTYIIKWKGATNPVSYKKQYLNRRVEMSFDVDYGTNPGV